MYMYECKFAYICTHIYVKVNISICVCVFEQMYISVSLSISLCKSVHHCPSLFLLFPSSFSIFLSLSPSLYTANSN